MEGLATGGAAEMYPGVFQGGLRALVDRLPPLLRSKEPAVVQQACRLVALLADDMNRCCAGNLALGLWPSLMVAGAAHRGDTFLAVCGACCAVSSECRDRAFLSRVIQDLHPAGKPRAGSSSKPMELGDAGCGEPTVQRAPAQGSVSDAQGSSRVEGEAGRDCWDGVCLACLCSLETALQCWPLAVFQGQLAPTGAAIQSAMAHQCAEVCTAARQVYELYYIVVSTALRSASAHTGATANR